MYEPTKLQQVTLDLIADHGPILVNPPISVSGHEGVIQATLRNGACYWIAQSGRVIKETVSHSTAWLAYAEGA